jgi:hypothetical protein
MNVLWLRNLVFVGLCLLALGALAASLLRHQNPAAEGHLADGGIAPYADVAAQVDAEFQQVWQQQGLASAPLADERTVARRLALGLMGTIPSLEELRLLEQVPQQQRLDWWISRILADRRYADYVAERLARAYVGTEGGPFLVYRRRRFVSWLSDELHANRPYNQLVDRLLSDTGVWTDSPAVNFVTVTADQNQNNQPDPIRLAARTSRAFLGMRIDCLQCHDDMLSKLHLGTPEDQREGRQSDFHELAAFFGGVESSLFGISDGKQDYRYKYLHDEEERVVPPCPPFQPELAADAGQGTRRERLARWVTHPDNKPFARAAVNRTWAMLFGKPLHEPVDDLPLYGEFPPALELLAEDFVQHGYDLQRLIRIIAASDVYRRASRAEFEVTAAHEQSWAVFPLTRLRPEQVAGSVIQAASLRTIDARSHIVFQLARSAQQNEFIRRYGDAGEEEFDDRSGTIAQRLLMMNGKLVQERTAPNPITNAVSKIAMLAPSDEKAIETVYLTVLTRPPAPAERHLFAQHLAGKRGNARQQELEDLYWVLINSTEFSWNH